jgi:peptide/nickel transport system substrate-binding protein
LYLYGDDSVAAKSIRQAIYDGPFELQDGLAVGTIFSSTPSFENGGARIEAVPVQAGDLVLDATGNLTNLYQGLTVRPAGCRNGDCELAFAGGELLMDQLIVTYDLVSNLTWADGTALSATDSLFSFHLFGTSETPGDKSRIEHSASYQALDSATVEWRGLPGYLDPDYVHNFWAPLPEHILGSFTPADLLSLEAANRSPLAWGAYSVESWQAGQQITLARNPNYWRAGEELPYFNKLIFRFVDDQAQSNIQLLLDGDCDVLMPSTGIESESQQLTELRDNGQAQLYFADVGSWLHLDFGIKPLVYDDGVNLYAERPDFFSLPEMRKAFAQCVDRQALIDNFAWGQTQIPNSYVSPTNALNNTGAQQYTFDPAAASATLESLGWMLEEDGFRVSQTVENVLPGLPLAMRLHTLDDPESLEIASLIKNSLDDCGIKINIISGAADFIFSSGSGGPLFGRNFDLALFSWPQTELPACYLYLSEAIPGADPAEFKYSWGGWNLTAWQNAEFDAACQAAMQTLPGEANFAEQHAAAQSIFAGEMPSIPLYAPQQIALTRPDFCGFSLYANGGLQNIEQLGYAEWCQ